MRFTPLIMPVAATAQSPHACPSSLVVTSKRTSLRAGSHTSADNVPHSTGAALSMGGEIKVPRASYTAGAVTSPTR